MSSLKHLIVNSSSYMYKFLHLTNNSKFIYTLKKINLELLDYRPDIVIVFTGRDLIQLYVHLLLLVRICWLLVDLR
jgi:hypothetical protein